MKSRAEKEVRLIRLLSESWGKDEADIQMLLQFDPVIKMLFQALLYQYEFIADAVTEYKKELLTDTARRLLPDYYFGAVPAHAIVQAQPLKQAQHPASGIFEIKAFKNFLCQYSIRKDIPDYSFINVSDVQLFSGDLRVIGACNAWYSITDKMELNGTGAATIKDNENVFYIGIKTDADTLKHLGQLVLFFGYDVSDYDKKWQFNAIRNAEWKINNQICKVNEGLPYASADTDPLLFLSKENSVLHYARTVAGYYRKNFISLDFQSGLSETSVQHPPQHIPLQVLENQKDVKIWITVKTNQGIDIEKLARSFDIRINAFPVMNCKLKSDRLTPNEALKPVDAGKSEYFLCMHSGSEKDNDSGKAGNQDELVLSGARFKSFDQTDLLGMVDTLLRTYDNEVSINTSKDSLVRENLDLFRRFSNIMHDLYKQAGNAEPLQKRMHIRSRNKTESFINYQYFVTNGDAANGIPAKQKFIYEGAGLKDKSAVSITPAIGGRLPRSEEEMLDGMRYLLLSRDRIVTREDVRSLCYSVFGKQNIRLAEVKTEIRQGKGLTGLHKVVVVYISLSKNKVLSNEQLAVRKSELIASLCSKSLDLLEMDFDVVISVSH